MPVPVVDVAEAARRFRSGEAVLLDVREPSELRLARVEGALHVPMGEVPARVTELPPGRPILVLCHHGVRSRMVAGWLRARGLDAINVAGGIDAWADEVDGSVGKY